MYTHIVMCVYTPTPPHPPPTHIYTHWVILTQWINITINEPNNQRWRKSKFWLSRAHILVEKAIKGTNSNTKMIRIYKGLVREQRREAFVLSDLRKASKKRHVYCSLSHLKKSFLFLFPQLIWCLCIVVNMYIS